MGKKRIFELAKELGYQNRDLIDKLQKLGFEVKSHSSSVDEEEVTRALRKAEDERKAATDEKQISRTVVRRRSKADEAEPTPVEAAKTGQRVTTVVRKAAGSSATPPPTPTAPVPAAPVAVARGARIIARRPGASDPVAAASSTAAATLETSIVPVVTDLNLSLPPTGEASGTTTVQDARTAEGGVAEVLVEQVDDEFEPKKREARTARPERERRREETYDEEDEKPEELEELGISLSDFATDAERGPDTKGHRVAPPPPSVKTATPAQETQAKTKIVRTIDPSVLKERLKRDTKRPEPPKEWGRPPALPPAADVAASPFTELVVRQAATGKGKEFVDVRKDAKGKRDPGKRRDELSARDLLEHRVGKVYYPTPGRKRLKGKVKGRAVDTVPVGSRKPVQIGETITIAELSQNMSRKAAEVIGYLMKNGVMATVNQRIDHDTAVMVCSEFGYEVESTQFDEGSHFAQSTVDPEKLQLRAPVVTVMGHVDHGKTSLLDRIRRTNVVKGEAGGITQRIAGYQVPTSKGLITFLDTPGHAAFTAMRARGANVTDIVILVVAADDGIMPQTLEAIDHARAANVPLIVAINKIDKPEANPDRVLKQLAEQNLLVEDWGGEVLCRKISAKTGDGVDDLLELIALQAEIMELKADPTVPGQGVVVEGHVHKGRGPVATVLIQKGTLRVGDFVVVGESVGRVRALMIDGGRNVKEVGPATPVEILGLDAVPSPADELRVASSMDDAKQLATHRRDKRRALEHSGRAKVSLQDLFSQLQSGPSEQKELRIILKGDMQGSVEALRDALLAQSTPKVRVNVVSGAVGGITESDVEFARASEAIIIGFAVRPDTQAVKAARSLGVDVRSYDIIYEAVDEVKLAMRGLLSPISKEQYLGRAEVRQTFSVPKVGTVAGCAVVDGNISRSAQIRLIRDSKKIYEGKLSSLKRFKEDVREVREGFECGMGIDRFNDIKVGDIIESFEVVMSEAALDEPTAAKENREARP